MKKGAPMFLGKERHCYKHRKHTRKRIAMVRDMDVTLDKGSRKNGPRGEGLPSDRGDTKHNKWDGIRR